MELGLFNLMSFRDPSQPQSQIYENTRALVTRAEELGFTTAWFAEHHFSNYCLCPSPLMMAAHCAARTSRIKLAPGVLVLPLYDPARLLGEIAMLDQMSDGRLVVGLGSGYQAFEFERFHESLDESVAKFSEMLDIIELGLKHDVIEYRGKHYQLPETPLCVRPVNPNPPVFVAGLARNEAVQTRMARSGYVPLVGAGAKGRPLLEQMRAGIEGYYEAAGLSARDTLFAFQNYVHITDRKSDALEAADHFRWVGRIVASMRGHYQRLAGTVLAEIPAEGEASLEEMVANTAIGSVEAVAAKLVDQIRSLRPVHMTCFMQPGALPHKKAMRSLERFAGEVIPLVEKELGPLAGLGITPATAAA